MYLIYIFDYIFNKGDYVEAKPNCLRVVEMGRKQVAILKGSKWSVSIKKGKY
jgi:hypothetical protein